MLTKLFLLTKLLTTRCAEFMSLLKLFFMNYLKIWLAVEYTKVNDFGNVPLLL